MAPVLPWLTDGDDHLDAALGRLAEAGAIGVTGIPLHLRPGAREWFMTWLARERPDLVPRYRRLYGRGAYVSAEYRAWLRARVDPLLERHGFGAVRAREAGGVPGDESVGFPEGSLPRLSEATQPRLQSRPAGAVVGRALSLP